MNRLLSYYQKELNFLKQHGKIFASRFPKIARRLGIIEGESEDPHISRLIESFAFLTSRIHQRLDDSMPEFIDDLMAILAPQFINPLPSICVAMIEPDMHQSGLTGKNIFAADTALFSRHSTPLPCQFQTIYPVTLLPMTVNDALLDFDSDTLNWKLKLSFQIWPGAVINNDIIRIYLNGPSNAVNTIYTLMCSEVESLILYKEGYYSLLSSTAIKPVGFTQEESLLTREPKISPVHILLIDYFWFPQKFSFVDIHLPKDFCSSNKEIFNIQMVFRHNHLTNGLEKIKDLVSTDFFRLHCTPAVNLFPLRAEPIILEDSKSEHPIIPDIRYQSHFEVWAVQQVSVQKKINNNVQKFYIPPLLERHSINTNEVNSGIYWKSFRREMQVSKSIEKKQYIAFSEHPNRQLSSEPEVITIDILCTNHYLPSLVQFGNPDGDFDTDAPVASLKITALTHPTRPIEPPTKSSTRWHFLSQLSLNHQLLSGEQGVIKLKEILALYDFNRSSGNLNLFDLIKSLNYQPITARLISNDPNSLARGVDLTIIFKHNAIQEPEYYLLCCLLDHLLALYAPINSFTRLTTCIEHENQTRRTWPIRAARISWL